MAALAGMAWTIPAEAAGNGDWRVELARQAEASIVHVLPQAGRAQRNLEEPEGTGAVMGDGLTVVTADHVLGGANRVLVRYHDGMVGEARIVLRDGASDLAVLSIDRPLPPLEFGDEAQTGEEVCTGGNAFGIGTSFSCGIVSATGRSGLGFNLVEDFIQTDAAVNPGMSGAPLLDREGRLAGIVTAIFTKGERDANIGVNFAQSARLVSAFLADAGDGVLDRPRPGLAARPAPAPGETGKAGALVMQVREATPEARAGLQAGDLITEAGGTPITTMAGYVAALALLNTDPGKDESTLAVTYIREGESRQVELRFSRAD